MFFNRKTGYADMTIQSCENLQAIFKMHVEGFVFGQRRNGAAVVSAVIRPYRFKDLSKVMRAVPDFWVEVAERPPKGK